MSEILPLIRFFESLRQNDIPLGIGEYEKILVAIQQQTGLSIDGYAAFIRKLRELPAASANAIFPKHELLRIAKMVWLKPNQGEQLFEDLFEEYFSNDFISAAESSTQPHYNIPSDNKLDMPASEQRSHGDESLTGTQPINEETNNDFVLNEEESISQSTSVRIAVSEHNPDRQVGINSERKPETEKSKFLFTRNYYPIDNRKVYQNFKSYPSYRSLRINSEVDIQATLNKTIEKGYFNEIIFRKDKISVSHLLLLVDHQGSMIAFDPLVDSIIATLKKVFESSKDLTSKNLRILYFTNMSDNVFYENKMHTVAISLEKILGTIKNKAAGIIILSDGGAARRSYNINRVVKTTAFLKKLQGQTKKVAWLNPVSEERWLHSSAEGIAAAVPMFVANEKGIKSAVDFLKGIVAKKINPA